MAAETALAETTAQRAPAVPWWERNLAWLLVAPTIAMFVIFAFLPSITAILFAFSRVRLIRGGVQRHFTGLDNFQRAFEDPLVRQSVGITLRWTLIVTTIEIALGLALALLLAHGIRGRGIFTSLLIIPIIMPPVAISIAWFFMYDYNFGVFNYLLGEVGLSSVRWLSDPDIALYAMMLVDIW